jgi:hypothetical protein
MRTAATATRIRLISDIWWIKKMKHKRGAAVSHAARPNATRANGSLRRCQRQPSKGCGLGRPMGRGLLESQKPRRKIVAKN